MQLARIPYLVCGASKLQLSHPLNKRKKSVTSLLKKRRHSKQNTSEFTMKVRVWITTSSLFSQFNYQKYQWRSYQCWNYYCEKHCLIKASWCVFKWKQRYEFGPVFGFGSIKQLFPPYTYCCARA